MRHVLDTARRQAVHKADGVAALREPRRQVRTNEPGPAGHQIPHHDTASFRGKSPWATLASALSLVPLAGGEKRRKKVKSRPGAGRWPAIGTGRFRAPPAGLTFGTSGTAGPTGWDDCAKENDGSCGGENPPPVREGHSCRERTARVGRWAAPFPAPS